MSFFKTTLEVKTYINVDVNTKFDKFKPNIDLAAETFIRPLLGDVFFTEFVTAYNGTDPLTPQLATLLPYVQRPLAHYAAFLMIDEIGVQVGDLGIQQQFNQNSQPAPAWKVNALRIKYITTADAAADQLLEYLEQNASGSVFASWYGSDANTSISGAIVYKSSIASRHIEINNNRRIFQRLKKRIKDIEESYVKRLICTQQYDELVAQLRSNSLTGPNALLLEKLEPVISKKALYLALPMLAISIEAQGLMMYSTNDGIVQKQIAGTEEKKQLLLSLKDGEFGYEADEQKLAAFIKVNIADYPLISASPCYNTDATTITTNMKWQAENDPCNKHFST